MRRELDHNACLALLAAIVRRWWLDALERPGACEPDDLGALAEFMDLPADALRSGRPAKTWRLWRI